MLEFDYTNWLGENYMDYVLQPNEGIILQSINVKCVGESDSSDELILTNLNIIYIDRGVFSKKIKKVQYFPLNKLKKVNGKVQVIAGKSGVDGTLQLQFFFIDGYKAFAFSSKAKKEIAKWIKYVNSIVTGEDVAVDSEHTSSIAGKVARGLKDTVGSFTGVLFTKNNKKIISKCAGCGAPLEGLKGTTVKCKNCDNKQLM